MAWSLEVLERRYPKVRWREPVRLQLVGLDEEHYACRVCIANQGMLAKNVPHLPTQSQDIIQHVKDVHQSEGIDARRPYTPTLPPKRKKFPWTVPPHS